MRVLGISGSLRDGSYNTAVLSAAAKLLPEGSEFELYGELESLPPYNQDRDTDDPPAAVADLRRLIAGADALLIATPEYNGTIPGQLKQVVDWGSRPYGEAAALFGKPVAVLSASVTDYGAVWANDHLRRALGIAGARVVDVELAISRVGERVDPAGELIDPETTGLLTEALTTLLHSSQALARS